jgi:Chaperone of endosialidase
MNLSHYNSKISKKNTLIVGSVIIISTALAGVSFAASLNIPTNLENAAITIKKIFLSVSGVSSDPASASIVLDGSNGNITTNNIWWNGWQLHVGGKVALHHSDYQCAGTDTTNGECLLRTDQNGNVILVSPLWTSGGTGSNTTNWLLDGNTLTGEKKLWTISNHDLPLITNNIEQARLTVAWWLGLGTTTPGQKFEIKGWHTDTRMRLFSDNNNEGIGGVHTALLSLWASEPGVSRDGVGIGNNIKGSTYYGRENLAKWASYMRLLDNSLLLNTIDAVGTDMWWLAVNNGNVGIGITTPSSKLEVNGVITQWPNTTRNEKTIIGIQDNSIDNNVPAATMGSSDGNLHLEAKNGHNIYLNYFNSGGDIILNAKNSRNVGIGTSSPTEKLHVNGNVRATAYLSNSDSRYKSHIKVLPSALASILKLSWYSYYNKLSETNSIGIIAQEVEKIYPELVQTDHDGYKSVEYANLVAPIIEAIKELATKIDNLFSLYLSQQAKINTLEARLLKLESQTK